MRTLITILCLPVLLCLCGNAGAQIEVSAAIDINYPVLTNSYNHKLNYEQPGAGGHIGISYKPTGTQFFPTVNLSAAIIKIPLVQFGNNVAVTGANMQSLMLNGNFVITFRNNNSLYLLGGIGLAHIKTTFLDISGPSGGAMQAYIDSTSEITHYFPAVGLGMEYVYGDAVNHNLYLSVGLYFQDVLLLPDENNYSVTIKDNRGNYTPYQTSLTGNLIVPNFYICLHYLLGKNIIFWQHKDSKYL